VKILVTGRTGHVGSHLSRLTATLGASIAAGRDRIDLAQPDSIRALIREVRPDVIVNAAGLTHVDMAEAEPALVWAVNAVAPGVFAEEAKRLGALLVHYSSVYIFDGTAAHPYTESDRPNPINAYGRSKLAGEQAIAAVGATALLLRASWVYDVRGRNFVNTMLRLAAEQDELRVVDDQRGSPTWALSIAQATVSILGNLDLAKDAAGTYNLAARGDVTRYDFTRRTLELTRSERNAEPRLTRIKTADFPLPAARPLNSVLDSSKLTRTFPVALQDWDTQLEACLKAARARARRTSAARARTRLAQ
jgi:dTDP-4-dehydrorhamnose reductase